MKEDIQKPKVENVTVAVVREINELQAEEWKVYLLNKNPYPLENVLVTSKGYGEKEGEKQETSVLRHYLEQLEGNSAFMIEPIQPDVFHLNNEFWVSYYSEGRMFDKKFIFVPDSIQEDNLHYIEMLDKDGVVHS
jgi:hypothetical protein